MSPVDSFSLRKAYPKHDPAVFEEFASRLTRDGECLLFSVTEANRDRSYGWFKERLVHRTAYEWAHGPIPEGLQIDHLCRRIRCVAPTHLEAVTNKVNSLRGRSPWALNAQKTHCPKGHPLSGKNAKIRKATGARSCRICINENQRAWRKRAAKSRKRDGEELRGQTRKALRLAVERVEGERDAAIADAASLRAEVERLRGVERLLCNNVERLQGEADEARAAMRGLVKESARHLTERDEARARVRELHDGNLTLAKRNEELGDQLVRWQREGSNKTLTALLTKVQGERDYLAKRVAELRADLDALTDLQDGRDALARLAGALRAVASATFYRRLDEMFASNAELYQREHDLRAGEEWLRRAGERPSWREVNAAAVTWRRRQRRHLRRIAKLEGEVRALSGERDRVRLALRTEVGRDAASMALPPGKTCADCRWFTPKCSWLLSRDGSERSCDWLPSKFRPKPEAPGGS